MIYVSLLALAIVGMIVVTIGCKKEIVFLEGYGAATIGTEEKRYYYERIKKMCDKNGVDFSVCYDGNSVITLQTKYKCVKII